MTKKSKSYLIITIVAIALVYLGAWGYNSGNKITEILGAICFIVGFIIMLVLYGNKWLDWWGKS